MVETQMEQSLIKAGFGYRFAARFAHNIDRLCDELDLTFSTVSKVISNIAANKSVPLLEYDALSSLLVEQVSMVELDIVNHKGDSGLRELVSKNTVYSVAFLVMLSSAIEGEQYVA